MKLSAQMKLHTEKPISVSSQLDRYMTRLAAPTDYEPNVIRLFHNQKGHCGYDYIPLNSRGIKMTIKNVKTICNKKLPTIYDQKKYPQFMIKKIPTIYN